MSFFTTDIQNSLHENHYDLIQLQNNDLTARLHNFVCLKFC